MKAAIIILSVVVVGLVALLWWLMKALGSPRGCRARKKWIKRQNKRCNVTQKMEGGEG